MGKAAFGFAGLSARVPKANAGHASLRPRPQGRLARVRATTKGLRAHEYSRRLGDVSISPGQKMKELIGRPTSVQRALNTLEALTPRNGATALFVVVLLVWGTSLYRFSIDVAGGADSSGYMNNARLLLEGRVHDDARVLPELRDGLIPVKSIAPLGFRVDPETMRLIPGYPFGFPLVLAPFQAVFGDAPGTRILLILIGLAGPILTLLLARESGLSPAWAVFCAVAVATSTLYQIQAFFPMTDVFTLVIACLVLLFLYRLDRDASSGFLLGAFLALAVLSRPANILLFVPVGLHLMTRPDHLRHGWKIILGGLPGAAFQIWLNITLYNKVLTTSYGDFSSLFKAEYFFPTLLFFGLNGLILVTPMALVGFLCSPIIVGSNRGRLLPLLALAASFIGFYAFYFHSSQKWWTLRFILPAFPAIIILGAHFWSRMLACIQFPDLWSRIARWTPVVFTAAAIIIGYNYNREKGIYFTRQWENSYRKAAQWLEENSDKEDVVICKQVSGALFYYLPNPILRYETIQPDLWTSEIAPRLLENRRVFTVLYPYEIDQGTFGTHIPGDWNPVGKFDHASIFELSAPP